MTPENPVAANIDCADREISNNSSVNENGVGQANELNESLSPSQETTIGLTFCASNIFLSNRILWKDIWRKGCFNSTYNETCKFCFIMVQKVMNLKVFKKIRPLKLRKTQLISIRSTMVQPRSTKVQLTTLSSSLQKWPKKCLTSRFWSSAKAETSTPPSGWFSPLHQGKNNDDSSQNLNP